MTFLLSELTNSVSPLAKPHHATKLAERSEPIPDAKFDEAKHADETKSAQQIPDTSNVPSRHLLPSRVYATNERTTRILCQWMRIKLAPRMQEPSMGPRLLHPRKPLKEAKLRTGTRKGENAPKKRRPLPGGIFP